MNLVNQPVTSGHVHEFRYYAAVNLDIKNETVGVIDVWRCATCHVKSAELRAHGLNNLPAEAGFQMLDGPGVKWAVFVCAAQELPEFNILRCRAGDVLDHDCVEKNSPITVASDYSLQNKSDLYHRIINLEEYFNDNVDVSVEGNDVLTVNSISIDR